MVLENIFYVFLLRMNFNSALGAVCQGAVRASGALLKGSWCDNVHS